MPTYLFAYHGVSLPKSKDEQAGLMNSWDAWMDGLGAALEGSNNPIKITRTVGADGVVSDAGENPVLGLSFVTAGSIDEAVALAKTCPHLATGGSIEVAELLDTKRG